MHALGFIIMLSLLASGGSAALAKEGGSCPADFGKLVPDMALAKAEAALGKTFSEQQRLAIRKANDLIPDAAYSANQVAKQEKLLLKAKLKPADILELRRHRAITNTKVEPAVQVPQSARVVELGLKPIDSAAIDGKRSMRYIVDSENNVFILDEDRALPADTLWLVQNKNSGSDQHHLVKETGVLQTDGRNGIKFTPDYDLDTTHDEITERIAKLEQETPSLKVNREVLEKQNHAQVLRCVDMMAKNTSTKKALYDRLIADNLMLAGAMAATEAGGAGRLATAEGRQVIMADFVGNNINSVIGAYIGKYLVQTKRSLPVSLATRTAVAMGMIEVQKNVYVQMLDKNPEERADKIAAFDRYYFFARLPIAHFADQFILKKLPELLFEACKKDSKVGVYITPGRVRIVERAASTILYYEARSAIVAE